MCTREEIFLMVLDLDDVLPTAGNAEGTGGLIKDKDVEMSVARLLGV